MNRNEISTSRSSVDWTTILLSGSMVVFGFLILFAAFLHWWRTPQNVGIDVLITAVGAFGTLVLAAATFFSVRESIRNVSEIEREREKPIVKEEIVKVIQPAIEAAESNIERQQERNIDWVTARDLVFNASAKSDRPSSIFIEPSPAAMARLSQTRPDLWSRLEDHQELMTRMMELGNTIRDNTEPHLRVCADELNWKLPEGVDEVDVDLLVSSALKDLDEFGEGSKYYSFWERYGDDICEIVQAEASDELRQLQSYESQWTELCEELSVDLREHKVELQQVYGISESTIEDASNERPAIF